MFVGHITRQQGQLPVETTGFVGREGELARLGSLLDHARLVTVTGPGGVGKTRLALRAAATAAPRFPDGVCLVELSSLHDPSLLVPTVADALGLAVRSPGPRLDTLLAHLRDRRLLLVLDTCEHLIEACAMLAESITVNAPQVTMLATSREPLDVIGENACPIAPLPVGGPPDGETGETAPGSAVDLFLQRASAAVPGFTVTPADQPSILTICQRLDGLPLAIELAAVRLRALPIAELARRLDQRLPLLTSGHGRGRHKTLRNAIDWSHELCTPAERAAWARLSVFAGPFTMCAAEEVCADEPGDNQVMPTVIRLVDKSVLVRTGPADAGGQPTQYLMLDTIREFGAEKLAESGDVCGIRHRFVARYLAAARLFRDRFLTDDQLIRLRELRREHANVTAALHYAFDDQGCQAGDGVELATALAGYWRAQGLAREGSYWLAVAVERAPEGSAARTRAALELGRLLTMQGDAAAAIAHADAAIALDSEAVDNTALDNEVLVADGCLVKTGALRVAGQLTAAAAAGQEAGRRLAALGDRLGLINLEIQLGYLALLSEDTEGALRHVESGLRRLGNTHERWLHANLYLLASLALYLAGRDIESTWAVTRALQVTRETGDIGGIAFALEVLGWLAARGGAEQRAAWLLGGADPLWERAGGRLATAAAFERLRSDATERCSASLGASRFADLAAKGRRYPLESMIGFALHDAAAPGEDDGGTIRLPGPLTTREREIASLVAAGLSNRQIAEQLFISRRTVDAHLEHIFGKLGITSRVMLTIQLREHSTPAGGNAST